MLGSLAAQSLKNTDSPNVHLGTQRISSPSSSATATSAAGDLGACYGRPLLGFGPGAGHSVVLCVSRCGCHSGTQVCGRELAQSLKHANLCRGEAIRGRGGGGGSVRGR